LFPPLPFAACPKCVLLRRLRDPYLPTDDRPSTFVVDGLRLRLDNAAVAVTPGAPAAPADGAGDAGAGSSADAAAAAGSAAAAVPLGRFSVKLLLDWRMTLGEMKAAVIGKLCELDPEVRVELHWSCAGVAPHP
jgi:hypothetical protein